MNGYCNAQKCIITSSILSKLFGGYHENKLDHDSYSRVRCSFRLPSTPKNANVIGKKGTTSYVTHFIFRPLQSLEIPGVGTAHLLEAVGTTQNLKGEPMLDKIAARCTALNVESGDKKYIEGPDSAAFEPEQPIRKVNMKKRRQRFEERGRCRQ
jgi:hypothetical protein